MLQKKARYVMQALQSGAITVLEIVERINKSDYIGYLYAYHIRDIAHELRKKNYLTKTKVGKHLEYSVLKPVSSQGDIKFD